MNKSTLTALLQQNITTCSAVYQVKMPYQSQDEFDAKVIESKRYTFKLPRSLATFYQPMDVAVVESTRLGSAVCVTVLEIHPSPILDINAEFEYKWLIDKVDMSYYTKLHQMDQTIKEALEHAEKQRVVEQARQDLINQFGEGIDKQVQLIESSFIGQLENLKDGESTS